LEVGVLLDYNILKNESKEHFIWRLYSKFYETGKLSKDECGEICRTQLEEEFDESAYRKTYQAFMNMWNEVKDEYVSEESLLMQIEVIQDVKDELYKQQVKTRDWTREKRKTLRDEARVENIKDAFKDALENATEIQLPKYEKKHVGTKEAILMLSDFHVGLEIKNYWNTYNKEVFEDRISTIVLKVMKYAEIMNIGTLYVASLGDLISGAIHITTRLAEEMDVLEQAMYVAKVMKSLLSDLSDFGLDIKYLSVVGNHDRQNKNYKEHIEKQSFNKLIDWYIEEKVSDGVLDIEFISNEIDDGIGLFKINGEHCYMVHGHQDSMQSVLMNLSIATGIIPKYILMGHYHNKNSMTQGRSKVFINGSLVGVDEYAKDKRYFSEPSQSLLVFDEDDVIDIELKLT